MQLPLSRAVAPDLVLLPAIGSTNAELAARASAAGLPEFSVLVTTDQTAGRGRLGRSWVAPPGRSLAVSVLLRPNAPANSLGWIPLVAGLAMTRAVRSLLPGEPVSLKWPNDVLVGQLKVCGILAEIVPGAGIVVGAGLNLTMTREQLPVPTATSLLLAGADPHELVDRALAAYLGELRVHYAELAAAGFDAERAGLSLTVTAACGTLGAEVRVELPGGGELVGVAEAIDEEGRLVVRSGAHRRALAAGDVTHLRRG